MTERKMNFNEHCRGCLTKDRPLVSIKSNFHIFLKLMDGEIDNIGDQANIPMMCWECRAVLRNSERFLVNVKKANEFLNEKCLDMDQVKSFSNLTSIMINNYEIQKIHDNLEIEIKTNSKSNDITDGNLIGNLDVDIKVENLTNNENFETDAREGNAFVNIKEDLFEIEQDIKQEPDLHSTQSGDDINILINSSETQYCLTEDTRNREVNLKRPHDFYKRFAPQHANVTCDYCGKRFDTKRRLIKHIRIRHSKHYCEKCNRSFLCFDDLVHHIRLNHVASKTEQCYCVECDVQFDNISYYIIHLKDSDKHKNNGVPCPICKKVYNTKYSMNNHYRFVHLKKTPYYCKKCSRFFLNSYRLSQHVERIHEKIPAPKDRICPHCDRGFASYHNLRNHIRSHTGEHPFVCDICSANFSKKTLLATHRRSTHNINNK